MSCIAPIVLNRKSSNKFRTGSPNDVVPCGRCPKCLQRRQSSWQFRLEQEQKISDTAAFLTLTYNEENIHYTKNGYPTLCKRDHQLFMKRLRKEIKSYSADNKRVRYYAVGEYGKTTFRPHMHSISFDIPKVILDNPDHLAYLWQKGHVQVDECNGATIAYVSKYLMKQLKLKNRPSDDDRLNEFSLMSKKMGSNYLTDNMVLYHKKHKNPYLVIEDGKKIVMPRYYKDKMFTKSEKTLLALKAKEHLESKDDKTEYEKLIINQDHYRKQDKKVRLNRNKF